MLFGGGHPGVTSGARAFAGRLNVVWRRPVRGFAVVIRASQVAPLRLRAVECCFASVVRASRVAPVRLRAVECCFVSAGSRFCVGYPGVTSGVRAFAGRSTVVLRWSVRGVARRGAIHDARCRNGTIGRPRLASADVACCGRFVVLYWPVRGVALVIRRHKWRPYVWGWLNVVLRWLVRGVARRGAIHDARCRNGTIGRPRWASADVAWCGRFVVLYWPVRGIAVVIRASQVAPLRLGVVECCFAVVIRASRVASVRLGAVECCFAVAGSRRSP